MRRRLDAELVRRGLSRSRDQASELIAAGAVKVAGVVATKVATQVDDSISIVVDESAADPWVSRGAHKLIGALDAFGVPVAGRCALDAGISTGGFTQVLLSRGVSHVVGVDVGYGQVAWAVRNDPRVTVMERTNIRSITISELPYKPELIVADLSFISLTVVLPALVGIARPDTDMLVMVKPQFEVGKDQVGTGGVVRDPFLRAEAVMSVATSAWEWGWGTAGVVASPLPGPQGNVEYFLWLRKDAVEPSQDRITQAVQEGPA